MQKKEINMYEAREFASLNERRERFVKLGIEKHGNRYDYSMAIKEYKNNRTPVHLICNKCESEPFKVYPFAHTDKGENQKGTCQDCYITNLDVQKTRWDPNLPKRIKDFRAQMIKKHGKGRYSYPYLNREYKNEDSIITVQCNKCKSTPYTRLAKALKDKQRYAGCELCNQEKMTKTIKEKNRKRQLRNQRTKDMPREYGCIYKITNTKNEKFYIGYTNLSAEKRFKSHIDETRRMQKGKKGRSSYLHNSMGYYGVEHFKVEVLEDFTNVTPIFLAKLEMKYIAKEEPHYNVTAGGELGAHKMNLDVLC